MKTKAVFYHAGCPVCINAEQQLAAALDPVTFNIEIVHLGRDKDRIKEAQNLGIKSVPALLIRDQVFHINFGASLDSLS